MRSSTVLIADGELHVKLFVNIVQNNSKYIIYKFAVPRNNHNKTVS